MAAFAQYIRGIIFFLVFASFIGIILPEGKYKSYINIVLGFIVMFLVFEPMSGFLGEGSLDRISAQISQATIRNSHEGEYQELIADAFRTQMREQVSRMTEAMGYSLVSLDASIVPETGEVSSVALVLSRAAGGAVEPVGIAPITVGESDNTDAESVKKIVSDFYRLAKEHIYVTIR